MLCPLTSVAKQACEFVVGEHSLWVELVSDVDKARPAGEDAAQLVDGQLEVLGPVRPSTRTQHYLLERRPVAGVYNVLPVRPSTQYTHSCSFTLEVN